MLELLGGSVLVSALERPDEAAVATRASGFTVRFESGREFEFGGIWCRVEDAGSRSAIRAGDVVLCDRPAFSRAVRVGFDRPSGSRGRASLVPAWAILARISPDPAKAEDGSNWDF